MGIVKKVLEQNDVCGHFSFFGFQVFSRNYSAQDSLLGVIIDEFAAYLILGLINQSCFGLTFIYQTFTKNMAAYGFKSNQTVEKHCLHLALDGVK